MQITATAVPDLLQAVRDGDGDKIDSDSFIFLTPGPDYVGPNDYKPMKGKDGNDVFVTNGEIILVSSVFSLKRGQS